jgi:carbonic anhydrase
MKKLLKGLVDFHHSSSASWRTHFKDVADGQKPEVLMIACCDSRVAPHLLADAGPGELFEVRTVGNIVAPANAKDGFAKGDVSEASAIEFALGALGIRDIAVCGHSNCGAMKALLAGREKLQPTMPHLADWLGHADGSLGEYRKQIHDQKLKPEDALSQINVLHQMKHVASYSPVQRLLERNELTIHGLWFDISSATVSLYEDDKKAFVPLDTTETMRLLTLDV